MIARPKLEAIDAASITQLPTLISGWQSVCYNVLADGTLAVLVTDADITGEQQRLEATDQAGSRPESSSNMAELIAHANAQIWTAIANGPWMVGPSFPLETAYPQFARFGDGRWLIVATRTQDEPNARVLGSDGDLLARFMLGDGIEHIAIDTEERIWVGWFDQGIFGNRGWSLADHEWPPSSNGIGRFTDDGDVLPLPAWPTGVGPIDDCYALSVIGASAWVCPYMNFPLMHLVPGGKPRWWRSRVSGAEAIAIDGDYAVLAGGYTADANRLALIAIRGSGAGEYAPLRATWRLPLRRLPPSESTPGRVWHRPDLLTGCDDTIHLVDDGTWYRWRIQDLTRP